MQAMLKFTLSSYAFIPAHYFGQVQEGWDDAWFDMADGYGDIAMVALLVKFSPTWP